MHMLIYKVKFKVLFTPKHLLDFHVKPQTKSLLVDIERLRNLKQIEGKKELKKRMRELLYRN